MQKRIFYVVIISIYANIHSSTERPIMDDTATIVKKIAKNFMQQNQVPGMAIVLYVQNQSYFFYFGYADAAKKIPVNQDTVFEIGSISKIFMCLLLAQEIIDGHMQLSDPISQYVPRLGTNKTFDTITLLTLATHTSTLPLDAPSYITSEQELITYLTKWHTPQTPNQSWRYSNHGIELIRMALEKSTHQTINNLILTRILQPLHMSEIGTIIPEKYKTLCAKGYTKQGNETDHYWHHPYLIGSGSIRASAPDMLAFLKAAIGLPGTPPNIKNAMRFTQTPFVQVNSSKQGLVWNINDPDQKKYDYLFDTFPAHPLPKKEQQFNGDALIHKGGTTQSFHSYIAVIPNRHIGVVVMHNRMLMSGYAKTRNVGNDILLKTAGII